MITVSLGGATGWAGSALARGIAAADDLRLVSAGGRRHAGQNLGAVLEAPDLDAPIVANIAEALAEHRPDVYVEYTPAASAKAHILTALTRDAHVVVGSSGLTDDDFAEIDALARERGRGVLAVGNFAITVVLLQKFAEMAARYIPNWEIIDFAYDGKPDAPSGTARELATRLGQIHQPTLTVPLDQTAGDPAARGATLAGSQVHSIRLPGFVIGIDAIFGLPDQTLTLRYNAGPSAEPYVAGALLAIRKVPTLTGLHRGLDTVMDL